MVCIQDRPILACCSKIGFEAPPPKGMVAKSACPFRLTSRTRRTEMRKTMHARGGASLLALTLGLAVGASCGEPAQEAHHWVGADAERFVSSIMEGDPLGENRRNYVPCSLPAFGDTGPVIFGLRRVGSDICCGRAKCIARQSSCRYGQYVDRCGDCTYFDCTFRPDYTEPACHWQPPPREGPPRQVP
jgi:hypothetical protein